MHFGIQIAARQRVPNHTDQDLLDAQVRKLHLEAAKLDRELKRMSQPFWRQPAIWRSAMAAAAVSAAVFAAISRSM